MATNWVSNALMGLVATASLALAGADQALAQYYPDPGFTPYPHNKANDGTGLTLGVYIYETGYGPKISGLMPATSADAAGLMRGDIIQGFWSAGAIYPVHSLQDLREAKLAVGPNQPAIVRLYRPNFGYLYPTLTFTADAGTAAFMKKPVWKKQTIESKKTFEKALQALPGGKLSGSLPKLPTSKVPQPKSPTNDGVKNPAELFQQGSMKPSVKYGQIPPLN